ncbi:MAG: VOC family protein [Planctomycetia bacterium]
MSPPVDPELFCVELRTAHWEKLVEWYRSTLGLTVLMRVVDDGYALLAAGRGKLAILARESPGPASGRISLGFEVADLDAVHRRLVAAGTDATAPRPHPEGFREVVVHDPDGTTLRLFSWPPRP